MSAVMVSSLLNGGVESGGIPVEHLDYDFIQKCSDVKYLERIVIVLRSGQEGLYPHLTEFCEKRIEKLNPKSHAIRKANLPATAASFSADEWNQITEDLKMWEREVKMNELDLKQKPISTDTKMPPVRSSNVSVALKQMFDKENNTRKKNPVPRNYSEWDKFDVEKECSKVDEGIKEQNSPTAVNHPLPKISRKIDTEVLTVTEKAVFANCEKEKGNEAFRANDFEEAVAYYTRSLSVKPTAVVYNNRAQAEIKLELWHSALDDCEKALELEPGNLKALLRRATIQKQLGDLKMAADDLRRVLHAEPQNAIAKKLLEEVDMVEAATPSVDQRKGTKMLIQDVEDEDEDDDDEAAPAQASLCVGEESVVAPGETGDMGNAHKKPPGRGDGAPHGEHTPQGHWRGKRGSLDKHRGQEPAKKDLANGAQGAGSGGAERNGDASAGSGGDDSRLDAPCGALPPPLARLKNHGNQLFKNGQFADALDKYSQAITGFTDSGIDSPEDLSILYSNRAACYLKDGNSTECIQDCTRALELRPFSLKPLLRRAMAHESLERYRKAYVDFKTVLQIDMSVQSAHDSVNRITKLLIEQDGPDWREKLPEIPLVPLSARQHRKEEPPNAELAQARAARVAQETARKAEARFASTKQEGNDCVKNSQFQEAVEKYSECLKLKPDECAIYTNRAICYLKLELFEEAKQDCDSALQLEPSNKKAFYRRALAYKGLKDYLACSSDLQEVLQLDPNVHEAERELEEVTVLLRQSLAAAASPAKPRKSVPITEVDGSEDEADVAGREQGPQAAGNDCDGEGFRIPAQPTNAYEFGQALNAARSRGDTAACAELLQTVAPETLPQYVGTNLDGHTVHFLMQALDGHLLQTDPYLVYQHLSYLHTAERFSMVLMLLDKNERRQMTQLFERLAVAENGEFTANDVQNLANRYI
ncbi:sperm-associated antigen 1A [Conger conger]|uniref:sperm-associated antigen 1A n=1 Tax=Conger conger TaxID=82655 RepID=UPI002A5A7EEA|nr:sperm-associated antigen 1A [Conger conger]